MLSVFETILKMSLTASIVILVVMLARILLSKAPKKYAYLLWLVVAFRLCVPFSFESSISIFNTDAIPSFDVETSTQETVSDAVSDAESTAPEASDEISVPSAPVTPNEGTTSVPLGNENRPVTPPSVEQKPEVSVPTPEVSVPTPEVSVPTPEVSNPTTVTPEVSAPTVETPVVPPVQTPVQTPASATDWQYVLGVVLASVWALGIICMLGCGILSYIKLQKRLQTAVLLYDNVYGSDRIGSPFALGIFRPRIYIPFGMGEESTSYILAHERYHIKRFDHLVKPLSFLILCVHWFNPLCWLAFSRMSLDMELSCDERVLKQFGDENMKKKYSKTLLDFATDNRYPTPTPISFSEGAGAKTRIKHALYWKKPRFWVSAIALLLCAIVLVACAANAVSNDPSDDTSTDESTDQIYDFGDVPYQFTFTSNGDGTCVITDIKTDYAHTEPFDLSIPETSPDGDKVVEVDMSVLDNYKSIFNVPGALTKDTFESIIDRIKTSEFKGENGVDAEDAAKVVRAFYNRHFREYGTHTLDDSYTFAVLENRIDIEEASRISAYLTDFIGYTAEDCYADCLAVLELDTDEETLTTLKEKAFRFFYHDASNIQKVILPSEDVKVHQSEAELTYELPDGTTFEPKYDNPVSIGYLTDDVDLFDPNTLHFAEKQSVGDETIMVTTGETVTQLCFFALDSTDGETLAVENVLLSGVVLTDAQTLVINTTIAELYSNRGIGFLGTDGKMHYYAILWSGFDGSLSLSEITDRVDVPLTLSIRRATEEEKHNENYLHFVSPGLTSSYDLIIEATETLYSLNVCKFDVADYSDEGGWLYTADPFDTYLGNLKPDAPLLLTVYPESITNTYGIFFKDDKGTLRYFAIFESELDGTISLVEITDQIKKEEQTHGETVSQSFEHKDGTLYIANVEDSYQSKLYFLHHDGTRVDICEQTHFAYLAFSDDQSKLIWNDYEWEWNATVCVYDFASQTLTSQPMDDLGENYTPSFMAWLDNRYFLFVVQFDHGTIARGGDIYVYDTETHEYRLLIESEYTSPHELMIDTFASNGQNITFGGYDYNYDTDLYVNWSYTVAADTVYDLIENGNSVKLDVNDGKPNTSANIVRDYQTDFEDDDFWECGGKYLSPWVGAISDRQYITGMIISVPDWNERIYFPRGTYTLCDDIRRLALLSGDNLLLFTPDSEENGKVYLHKLSRNTLTVQTIDTGIRGEYLRIDGKMLDENTGVLVVIAATKAYTFWTYDGGNTWTRKTLGNTPAWVPSDYPFNLVQFIDQNTVFAVWQTPVGLGFKKPYQFALSHDGGKTWEQISLPLPEIGTAYGASIRNLEYSDGVYVMQLYAMSNGTESFYLQYTSADLKTWTLVNDSPERPAEITRNYTPPNMDSLNFYALGSLQGAQTSPVLCADDRGGMVLYITAWNEYIYLPYTVTADWHGHSGGVSGDEVFVTALTWNDAIGYAVQTLRIGKTVTQSTVIEGLKQNEMGIHCYMLNDLEGYLMLTGINADEWSTSEIAALLWTENGGKTWTVRTESAVPRYHKERPYIEHFFDKDTFVISARFYIYSLEERTYVTFDGGRTWTNINTLLISEDKRLGYLELVEMGIKDGKYWMKVYMVGDGSNVYQEYLEFVSDDLLTWKEYRGVPAPLACPVDVVPTDKEPSIRFDSHAQEVFEFTFTKDVKGFAIVKIDTGVAYDVTIDPLGEPTDYKAGDTLVYSMYINDISDSRGFVLIGEDGKLHYYALRGPDPAGFSSDYSVVEVTDHPLLTVDGKTPDFNP